MAADRAYELLERLANLLRAEERAVGAAAALQPVHLHALAYLARCNRFSDTPAGVTEYLGLTKGTVSQTLALLQERGLVTAESDADDGRLAHLRLTPKGRRVVAQLPPQALADGLRAVADADALTTALAELLRALQRARGGRTFGVCHTCRHFVRTGDAARCGLVDEPLRADQTQKICREHEPAGTG